MRTLEKLQHQEEAVQFALYQNRGCAALFHEVGLGKTVTGFLIFKEIRKHYPKAKMIVFCPPNLIVDAWQENANDFFPEYKFHSLRGWKKIKGDPDVYALNFESMIQSSQTRKLKELFNKHEGPWLCFVDESSRMKNHKSRTAEVLQELRPYFKWRLIGTGTPAPNNETEYFSQLDFIRPGILGPSFYRFRNLFFVLADQNGRRAPDIGRISRGAMAEIHKRGFQYTFIESKREEFMQAIASVCHWRKKKDCLDLPDMVDEVRSVVLSPVLLQKYEAMARTLVAEIKGEAIVAPYAMTKLMKLREMISGFVMTETGEELEIEDKRNPKIRELFNTLDEIGPKPVIIWIHFDWEARKVKKELERRYCRADSEYFIGENQVKTLCGRTKDKEDSIRSFKNGSARYLVAHPASAGHGLTFTNCSEEIFFSLSYSLEQYEQCKGRTHRKGQVNKCTYIHLIARGTIDEKIYQVLQKKATDLELVSDFVKQYS
jgi:SNF2 family DNA or RNA helicase